MEGSEIEDLPLGYLGDGIEEVTVVVHFQIVELIRGGVTLEGIALIVAEDIMTTISGSPVRVGVTIIILGILAIGQKARLIDWGNALRHVHELDRLAPQVTFTLAVGTIPPGATRSSIETYTTIVGQLAEDEVPALADYVYPTTEYGFQLFPQVDVRGVAVEVH
jgi:hypothetical protein